MGWTTTISSEGITLLNNAAAGNKLTFTSFYIDYKDESGTDRSLMGTANITVTAQTNTAVIRLQVSNDSLKAGAEIAGVVFSGGNPMVRITGFSVEAVLENSSHAVAFCTCTAGSESDYILIPPPSNGLYTHYMDIPITISNTADRITVNVTDSAYATVAELNTLQTALTALTNRVAALEHTT